MTPRLTDAKLRGLKPAAPGKRDLYPDPELPRGWVRVTPRGTRVYTVVARPPGAKHSRPYVIGRYPLMTLEQLRAKGRAVLAELDAGLNPEKEAAKRRRAEEEAEKEEAARKAREAAGTLAAAWDRYRKTPHAPKGPGGLGWNEDTDTYGIRTGRDVHLAIKCHVLPKLGARPLIGEGRISRRDIKTLVRDLHDTGLTRMPDVLLSHLAKFDKFLLDRELVEESLTFGIAKMGSNERRARILKPAEIEAFWAACEAEGYPYGPIGQMLLASAQRLSEVAEARWSEFDFTANIWTLKGSRTKNGKEHSVPVTRLMLRLLRGLPSYREDRPNPDPEPFVFGGRAPVTGWTHFKRRLDKRMREILGPSMEEWRLHDLRRTAATGMGEEPINTDQLVIGAVLNHTDDSVTRIYNQATLATKKRMALDAWSLVLEKLVKKLRVAS